MIAAPVPGREQWKISNPRPNASLDFDDLGLYWHLIFRERRDSPRNLPPGGCARPYLRAFSMPGAGFWLAWCSGIASGMRACCQRDVTMGLRRGHDGVTTGLRRELREFSPSPRSRQVRHGGRCPGQGTPVAGARRRGLRLRGADFGFRFSEIVLKSGAGQQLAEDRLPQHPRGIDVSGEVFANEHPIPANGAANFKDGLLPVRE